MSSLIQHSRRGFLAGFGTILAAPAIVRASSLMALKPLPLQGRVFDYPFTGYWPLTDMPCILHPGEAILPLSMAVKFRYLSQPSKGGQANLTIQASSAQ